MRAFRQLCRVAALRTLREPAMVIFMLAFAPAFIVVMGLIFGNDPTPQFGNKGFLEANLTAFPGIVITISALIILPVDLVTQRTSGALRRFRATPLKPGIYLTADVVVRTLLSLTSIVVMYLVALLAFDVRPASGTALVYTFVATAIGLAAFQALGYLIAGLMPSTGAAQGVGNILVYPLIFTSGAAVPLAILPEGVKSVARFSPLTQLTYLNQGLWNGAGWGPHWGSLVALLALGVVCAAVAAKSFRWE